VSEVKGSFERRPPASRRRVRNGIRLKADDPQAWQGWVTRRWLVLLESLVPDAAERAAGLEYARQGQITAFEVEPGAVTASVQGRLARPYRTQWRLAALTDDQWRRALDAMSGEAFYAAKLLARELPPAIESLLGDLGIPLLPAVGDVAADCDCPAGGRCKHVAAVAYLLGGRLEADPLTLLRWRGLEGGEVLERLAVTRAQRTRGVAAAHAEPVEPAVSQPPLAECLEGFWRPPAAAGEPPPPPHHAPHALLRRLGPSPLDGRFPLVGLLASIYDTVAQHAVDLRDRAEGLGEPDRGAGP